MLHLLSPILKLENDAGSHVPSTTPSPKSASKKLASPLACLSLRKFEAPEEESEHLQQPAIDPYQDLETAYVAQVCLTWEALHCQYTQLTQKISGEPHIDTPTSYNQSAQQFQQFQVLLQRFIENEPFEHGSRPEIFARTRKSLPKLLQVPKIQGTMDFVLMVCVGLIFSSNFSSASPWHVYSNYRRRSI